MTSSRGKCRAINTLDDGNVRGCRGLTDALVLVRIPHDKQPGNYTFRKIGLCRHHMRQWIDSLENDGPPVRYKPHRPPTIEDLTGPDEGAS